MNWLGILNTGICDGILYAFLVIGLAVAFRLLKFPDLTIEGSFALGAAITASGINHYQMHWSIAMLLCLIGCAMAGIATAILYLRLGMSKFLAAITVVTGLYTIMLRIMHGGNLNLLEKLTIFDYWDNLNALVPQLEIGNALILISLFFIAIILLYLIFQSKPGLKVRAACTNPTYAEAIGIQTHGSLILGLALSNALAGTSGALFAMKSGFADIGLTQGILITALAALSVGERLLPAKRMRFLIYILLSAVIGSIIYQVLWATALQFNFESTDLKLISALLLIALYWLNRKKRVVDLEYA